MQKPAGEETAGDAREIGRALLESLTGPERMKQRDAFRNDFNEVLQDYSDEVCFGRIWSRDGIDRKQRSIINLAMLVALNRMNQFRNHIDIALNNGCSVREIQEILLQAAVYCGLPAATDAFKVAEDVLKDRHLL